MLLEARSLSLFGRFSDLNFSLKSCELLFLLGPNGAGKSSLLAVLSAYSTFEGCLSFQSKAMQSYSIPSLAQMRAWLPQQASIDPYLSIEQAFELALFPLGLNLKVPEAQLALSNIIKAMDLELFRGRNIAQLSGGEMQRVLIGLKLIQVWPSLNPEAKLLLLDEPTNGLDLKHQRQLFALLLELKQQGLAIVICVHDLNLALHYGDCVLMLKQGKQQFFGACEQAFSVENIRKVFDVDSMLITQNGRQHLLFD